ncbi:MAG: glycosyltransferase family 4 protein [Promethearchaeota archaeon]
MRIAIVKKKVPSPEANVKNTLSLAQSFFELGHNVEILAIDEFRERKWKILLGDVHKFFNLNPQIKIKYIKGNLLFYLRKFKIIRGIINFLYNFPKIYDLIDPEIIVSKYCIKKKYDLVICRDNLRTAYNNIINKIPTIIDLHKYKHVINADYLLKVKNYRYFKGITTLNNFLKNIFIKLGFPANKIKVMDNVIDLKKFDSIKMNKIELRRKLKLPLDKNIILYSGDLGDDRGIDTIVHSFKYLNNNNSLYFIGGFNEQIEKWEKYVEENEIDSDIHFLGMKIKGIVPYYLKAADVLLATFSPNCRSLNYMSPIKIIEYMASKTPFIATKIGRNTEICNNNECLFTNIDDPEDLSEKIRNLINDQRLREQLIENAYKNAENLTTEKKCNLFFELLSK